MRIKKKYCCSAGDPKAEEHKFLMSVNSTGHVLWSPPVIYKSSCNVDMTYFPFDEQTCSMKFGPWAHSSDMIDMDFLSGKQFDLKNYVDDSQWEIVDHWATKNSRTYDCCEGKYIDVEFFMRVRRQMTFHMRLIMVPTILLSIMSCAIFWIPPNRPDRTTLGSYEYFY